MGVTVQGKQDEGAACGGADPLRVLDPTSLLQLCQPQSTVRPSPNLRGGPVQARRNPLRSHDSAVAP